MPADNAVTADRSAEYRIGRLDDFKHHEVTAVEVAGRTIGVVRKDNAIYAFANRCPHHGAPMCAGKVVGTMMPSKPDEYEFSYDGLIIRCPWHAYEFNLENGESVGHTISSRLVVYPTEVRGGEVFCRLKRVTTT